MKPGRAALLGAVVLILTLIESVATTPAAHARTEVPYTSIPYYTTTICLNMNNAGIYTSLVSSAASNIDYYTNLVYVRQTGSTACAAYPSKIVVVTGYWDTTWTGSTGLFAYKIYYSDLYPDGRKYKTQARIRLNTKWMRSYSWNINLHIAAHELEHANGLTHRSDTCNTLVYYRLPGGVYCPWLSKITSVDVDTTNKLYGLPK